MGTLSTLNKKTEPPYSRQPGCLFKTRGFPPPLRNGFGFFLGLYAKHILKVIVKYFFYFFTGGGLPPIPDIAGGFKPKRVAPWEKCRKTLRSRDLLFMCIFRKIN
jgi:hypothetical protein